MGTRIFISSTGKDLADYRCAAMSVCRELGFVAVVYEDFPAMSHGATAGSLQKLDTCAIYVGIFAHRYGYIEEGCDRSVTELEFDRAGERGLEQLCFLADPEHPWPPKWVDCENYAQLEKFKARIDKSLIRALFTTVPDFETKLKRTLFEFLDGNRSLNLVHQLISPPADFVGRDEELAAMKRVISGSESPGATVCNLRGPPGIGKTALALRIARELVGEYPDAQLLLGLGGTDPVPRQAADVMAEVIHAFAPQEKTPEDPQLLAAAYRSILHNRRVLLLLDNASDEAQVAPLIPPPGCLTLITSRQWFTLPGQLDINLKALPAKQAQQLLQKICTRCTDSEASRIAKQCGGLPLALRLAGSALAKRPDLDPESYARRLEMSQARLGLSAGEISLGASIALSWELLAPHEASLLAQLAVFPGGFDLPAAQAIWGLNQEAASESLGRLLRASLLQWDDEASRYRLHELIRDFAASQLSKTQRDTAAFLHAEYFEAVLKRATRIYKEGGDSLLQGLEFFDRERRNIEAGFDWAREQSESELCARYPKAGLNIIDLRLHPHQRIAWFEAALAAAQSRTDRPLEGFYVGNIGIAYADLGEPRRAIEFYQRQLRIARQTKDRRSEGGALGSLGNAYLDLGEPSTAIDCYRQRLEIARRIGDRRGEGHALGSLGNAHLELGEPRRAIEYYEGRRKIARHIGDRRAEGYALGNLGIVYKKLGEPGRAVEFYEQHLTIARAIGDRRSEGQTLGNLGLAYLDLGKLDLAIKLHEQALRIAQGIGDRRGAAKTSWSLGLAYEELHELTLAAEMMQVLVDYEREICHPNAEKHAARVEAIRDQLKRRPTGRP